MREVNVLSSGIAHNNQCLALFLLTAGNIRVGIVTDLIRGNQIYKDRLSPEGELKPQYSHLKAMNALVTLADGALKCEATKLVRVIKFAARRRGRNPKTVKS